MRISKCCKSTLLLLIQDLGFILNKLLLHYGTSALNYSNYILILLNNNLISK